MRSIARKVSLGFATLIMMFQLTAGVVFNSLPAYTPAVIGIGVVVGTLPFTAAVCSKDQLVAAGEDVLSVVNDQALQNALKAISSTALSRLLTLVGPATDLVAALKGGVTTNALALVNTIFPVIEEIVQLVSSDPTIMKYLALGNIALHFIINHAKDTTAAKAARKTGARSVSDAMSVDAQPVWGCQYRQDKRCAALAH